MPEPILNWQFSNIESWGKLNWTGEYGTRSLSRPESSSLTHFCRGRVLVPVSQTAFQTFAKIWCLFILPWCICILSTWLKIFKGQFHKRDVLIFFFSSINFILILDYHVSYFSLMASQSPWYWHLTFFRIVSHNTYLKKKIFLIIHV
jgi:hypothetical protein